VQEQEEKKKPILKTIVENSKCLVYNLGSGEFMKRFSKFFYFIGLIFGGILLLGGSLENGLLFSVLSFVFVYLFVTKVPIRRFSLFLIPFCLITKVIVVLLLQTPLTGDFVLMYDTAKHMALEGIHIPIHSYFNCWGYQLFHVFYQALILKIIPSVTFLKILNCVYSTVITVLIYQLARKLTNEKSARIVALLYAIAFYPLYLNTILGNQQLALMLALLAIYVLLYRPSDIKHLVVVGILLGISHLERNEGIIYLLTSILYLFFVHKNVRKSFLQTLILIFCFFSVTKGASFLVQKLDINDIGLGNANPEWKFLLGFNLDTFGVYDTLDEQYLQDRDQEREEILKRVINFKALPNLFYQKTKIQFLYADFGKSFGEMTSNSFLSQTKDMLFQYTRLMNYLVILLAFIGIFSCLKTPESWFWVLNFCAFYGVYMLIEVCARYYFNPQVTIFLLASLGIQKVLSWLDSYIFVSFQK